MKQAMLFGMTFLIICTVGIEAKAESLVWKALDKGPPELIETYQSDKSVSTEPLNPKIAKFVEVKGQKAPVYLVDPNTSDLCGSAGCLIIGYFYKNNRYIKIFDVYTDSTVEPPSNPADFITVSKEMHQGLPCLDLQGLSIGKGKKARWCYNGKEYKFSRVREVR